jgi:Putative zinc-finger
MVHCCDTGPATGTRDRERRTMNLMYSCRRVAELISQSLDEPLGLIDRLRLRMHLKRCSNCGQVERQLSGIKGLSAELFASDSETDR